MTKEEVLQKCTVEGMVVKLPDGQLDRKLYVDVAKSLQLIGGKWKGGKVFGFVFPTDPTELLTQISNGEKRNLQKEYQFFGTSEILSDKIARLANIKAGHRILEPSAGQGAIVKAIHRVLLNTVVDCCELMEINQTFLSKIVNSTFLCDDFLQIPNQYLGYYDRIVANPPFNKLQDQIHIRKMYDCLKHGGRIVSISSKHWQLSQNKKETEFRNWLKEVNADVQEIEAGAFKESGTMISSLIIVINKK